MPRLVTTYIFREMAVPFFLSVAILSITALLGKVLRLVELFIVQGVGLKFILWFILSIAPSFLIYTLPASLLVAVLIACTRLSSDNEITAMKSSGISLFTIVRPVFFLAAAVFLATLLTTMYLYPAGNYSLRKLLFNIARNKATAGIEEKTFYDRFKGVTLYVDHTPPNSGELAGVFLLERTGDGESKIVTAERGSFMPKPEELSMVLKLENGEIHRKRTGDETYHIVGFSDYTLELLLEEELKAEKRGKLTKELYVGELSGKIRAAKASGLPTASYVINLQKRFSLPAVAFVFSIIGVPLGMQKVRSARTTGFGLAIGVLLVYYLLTRTLESLGEAGLLNPVIAAWGSDIALGSFGIYIFAKAARERPVAVAQILERAYMAVWKRIARAKGFKG